LTKTHAACHLLSTLHLQEVVTGRKADGWIEIREGLSAGDEIATAGIFHLKSLILKSEMGEGHAH
jgi:cobalt-zinc-cadmium efflux system membrane fusion protein